MQIDYPLMRIYYPLTLGISIFLLWSSLVCFSQAKKKNNVDVTEFLTKELSVFKGKCPLNRLTFTSVRSEWWKHKESDDTLLCLLKYIGSNEKNGRAWSMLGSSYIDVNKKTQANFCFQQSSKLIGPHTTFVDQWYFIGPFTIGKSEFDGDPSYAYGGIHNISKFRFDSSLPLYPSELAPNGHISWTTIPQPKPDEYVHVRPQIDWNDLVSSLSSMGITEWQGWLVGELDVAQSDTTLSFQCHGVARCIVGDNILVGDFYQREEFWTTAYLPRGTHPVFIPVRSKVGTRFKFSVSKKDHFDILSPTFLPDMYDGYLPQESFFTVPVTNLMTRKWLRITKATVTDHSGGSNFEISLMNNRYQMAPGQTMRIVGKVVLDKKHQGERIMSSCQDDSLLELTIKTSEGSKQMNLNLRCRQRGNSFLFTFIDHDGSVQHAAAIEPLGSCPDNTCPVILTLHGTTVPPQNQADSYKKMVDGVYEFGVKNMWLLAPTRHGAHNWEGPGALTAMNALNALHDIVEQSDWLTQKLDPWKVLFAGHSMGGHGSLHLATHFPDRAIGLISLAGWISKEDYGDSNLFFRHDVANSHVDPAIKSVMESCVSENDADKHVSNLKGIPTLLRVGAQDRTVHPYFLRRMLRLMKESGVDVTYSELPKLEHWWWDTKETNDGGCVNDKEIRTFMSKSYALSSLPSNSFESCSLDQGECDYTDKKNNKYSAMRDNQGVWKFVTFNPAFGGSLKGIRVVQQVIPLRKSVIEINVVNNLLRIVTKNVHCLEISDSVPDPAALWPLQFKSILIDDTEVVIEDKIFPMTFCRQESQWKQADDSFEFVRGPAQLGPARRVSEKSFVIVAGTQGNASTSSIILSSAVYIANQFVLTSDTVAPIVKDSETRNDNIGDKNLIIIGGPEENSLTAKYLATIKDLKFDNSKHEIWLGHSCHFTSTRTGLLTLVPNGKSGLALLLMGLSLDGLADIIDLATPTIPPMARSPFSNLLPDFVITGPDKPLKGPGGFECIGFWNNKWRYSAASSSCVCH